MDVALAARIFLIAVLMLAAFDIQTAESQSSFIDNFDSPTLGTEWNVIDDAGGSTFGLSVHPGWLRITTTTPPTRDLKNDRVVSNTLAPRIMLSGVSDDFTIETKIESTMNSTGEAAGILVWADNTRFIWLSKYFNRLSGSETMYCGQNDGIEVLGGYNTSNPIYLRMSRNGTLFTSYFSYDGIKWTMYHIFHFYYLDYNFLHAPLMLDYT